IEPGVGIDGQHHETVGSQLGPPPLDGGLRRDKAGDYHNGGHGAGSARGIIDSAATEAANQPRYAPGTHGQMPAAAFYERHSRIWATLVTGRLTRILAWIRIGVSGPRRYRDQHDRGSNEQSRQMPSEGRDHNAPP